MKKFLFQSLYFLIFPLVLFAGSILAYLIIDPYKIIRIHADYTDVLEITPGNIYSTQIINTEKYNAFLLGNSRTIAIPPSLWKNYLPKSARPFQFWAPGDRLLGITKKLFLLHKLGKSIDHAIIILCPCTSFDLLGKAYESQHYEYTNKNPMLFHAEYYWKAMHWETALISPAWLSPIKVNVVAKTHMAYIPEGNEHYLKYDSLIKMDSVTYYKQANLQGKFKIKSTPCKQPDVNEFHYLLLKSMAEIFKHHNTNYRIFISPLYNSMPISNTELHILEAVFGKERIFNFSGYEYITQNQGYYYEFSHYRKLVGELMLEESYTRLP